MNIKPNSPRKKAFTIVEVLMSICIIGISAAGLLGCFHFAMFAIRMARENQRATQIVLERAEAIRCYNWSNLTAIPTQPVTDYYNRATHEPPVYSVTTSLSPFSPFNGSAGGATSVPLYASKMQQLTILVTWTNWGIARFRTNITYIAFDGVQNYVY